MKEAINKDKLISIVERGIVAALQVLIVLLICAATIALFVLFANNLYAKLVHIESTEDLLAAMQTSFAGILIVVLGLELLETLRAYFVDRHVKTEVILVVAIIAVGRQVIQADVAHMTGLTLIGIASLLLALTVGYFLVKKTHDPRLAPKIPPEA